MPTCLLCSLSSVVLGLTSFTLPTQGQKARAEYERAEALAEKGKKETAAAVLRTARASARKVASGKVRSELEQKIDKLLRQVDPRHERLVAAQEKAAKILREVARAYSSDGWNATAMKILEQCRALAPELVQKDVSAIQKRIGDAVNSDKALVAIRKFIKSERIDTDTPGWKFSLPKPPKLGFTDGMDYFWNLSTNVGSIKIRLMPEVAPMHVSSTIYLTVLGFYDKLKFHRVIQGFMAQGGCPAGNGRGSPGYGYGGEFDAAVKHDRPGLLSMANAGPGTDGSQFFITFVPTPHLNGKHTIFGEVVDGMDTVKELERGGSRSGAPTRPLLIERAWITMESGN
ncbi:MAG: peptidylprolyl isomerase [Planctomycetota bacterium]